MHHFEHLFLRTLVAALLGAASATSRAEASLPTPPAADHAALTRLGDLEPVSEQQGWGQLQVDTDVGGAAISIGGHTFDHGLGMHANGTAVYDLAGAGFETFEAWVGVDDSMKPFKGGSVVFQVFGDGKKLFDSGVLRLNDTARRLSVPLAGIAELKLVVTDAGDGINCDHADWADAVLRGGHATIPLPEPKYAVAAPGLTLQLAADGRIVAARMGKDPRPCTFYGQTDLAGCRLSGTVTATPLAGGGYRFTRTLVDAQEHQCVRTDRFTPTEQSIRWEVEITSATAPWTTAIATRLKYPATDQTRFWTAWSDPDHRSAGWRDPLVTRPLTTASWSLGGPTTSGTITAIPLATIMEPAGDTGLSLVLSPEDTILTTTLNTSKGGGIRFSRTGYRLGSGKAVHFAMDLVAHEADWRGGLRWMVQRYGPFFDPPNPHADQMAGCGAYSGAENPIDVAKFKKMAFRINWKLSDDFPYMGMFIPPVKDADERWERSCDEGAPPDKTRWTSCRKLNDYAKYMKDNGFYVLDYFNVTEFGKNMAGPPQARPGDPDLWKDPRAFLTTQLPGAILRGGDATCYHASAVDPGDPAFQKFVLEQAQRHIRLIPDSSGICIDRLDWLAQHNAKADDGVSWVNNQPVRALCVSWNALLAQLGPAMHTADKVIFVNPIYSRLDLLRQVDGIYTEFGQAGPSLNVSALMGLRKPVLAWNYNKTLHEPDPDAFFQRHLLLGAYPTAPYPWNNHCITPEPAADQAYIDYGPLLDTMRGKKWVLEPHCVETTTPGVKVNLFQVPGGYALPVTFGGTAPTAAVTIRNIPGLASITCTALHPGTAAALPVPIALKDGVLELTVPLHRGCAMVKIATTNP